jgi:hypothetical protein
VLDDLTLAVLVGAGVDGSALTALATGSEVGLHPVSISAAASPTTTKRDFKAFLRSGRIERHSTNSDQNSHR